ncbi:hypothetical protein [Silvanigrella paludirubra]|uniref:hypothetical protein n=1 Tax=Silvanigrella paludirubra TaxID=2499159 RepID=UPI0012966428|nr:hypothetical protein [Silvanigrella paludirubra]
MEAKKEYKSGYKVVFDTLNEGIKNEEIDKKLYNNMFEHVEMAMDYCKKYDRRKD